MMKWMRERLGKDEGFTLIELMVVVLIIAILIAIAIPSFLGFRRNAQDRSAQSDIRNMLLTQQAYYTENEFYTETEADLKAIEPSVNEADTTAGAVDADLAVAKDAVCLTKTSESGVVFSVYIDETVGVAYAKDPAAVPSPCPSGAFPADYTADGWS